MSLLKKQPPVGKKANVRLAIIRIVSMKPLKKVNCERRTGMCGGVGYAHTYRSSLLLASGFFSALKNESIEQLILSLVSGAALDAVWTRCVRREKHLIYLNPEL